MQVARTFVFILLDLPSGTILGQYLRMIALGVHLLNRSSCSTFYYTYCLKIVLGEKSMKTDVNFESYFWAAKCSF